MPSLKFPFWIVTQERSLFSQPIEPEDSPGFIAGFSKAMDAASFMVDRGENEWGTKLINREMLKSLLEDLRKIGICGVCLDPHKDGRQVHVRWHG